jgi:hypothetical protein
MRPAAVHHWRRRTIWSLTKKKGAIRRDGAPMFSPCAVRGVRELNEARTIARSRYS